jgi:DNA-directed RNA polymerase subunit M/transcription elongation factor TFIIS
MQFCSECHNMYYLKIQDEEGVIGNTLIYYCRNCGNEDKTLSTTNICVSDIQLRTSEKKYTHIVNEYTKYDPTLPRINTIKCPNQECSSNQSMTGGGGKKTDPESLAKSAAQNATKAKKSAAKAKASLAAAEAHLETLLEEEEAKEQQGQSEQGQAQQQGQAEHKEHEQTNNREVIYIRYDDINMKYVYLCVHCDMTWRTDNRL